MKKINIVLLVAFLFGSATFSVYTVAKNASILNLSNQFAAVGAASASPLGSLDVANCNQLAGWAFDPDLTTKNLSINIYKEGNSTTGTLVGTYTANGSRSDIATGFKVDANHGFFIPTPASLKDGISHTVYAFAQSVDASGAADTLVILPSSPKTINCAAPVPVTLPTTVTPTATTNLSATLGHTPLGSLDQADCTRLAGWSFDPDFTTNNLAISLYKDGTNTTGKLIGTYNANVNRPDLVIPFKIDANHGFSIPTPASLSDGISHTVSAYAQGVDANLMHDGVFALGNSPKTLKCGTAVAPTLAPSPTPAPTPVVTPTPTKRSVPVVQTSVTPAPTASITAPSLPTSVNTNTSLPTTVTSGLKLYPLNNITGNITTFASTQISGNICAGINANARTVSLYTTNSNGSAFNLNVATTPVGKTAACSGSANSAYTFNILVASNPSLAKVLLDGNVHTVYVNVGGVDLTHGGRVFKSVALPSIVSNPSTPPTSDGSYTVNWNTVSGAVAYAVYLDGTLQGTTKTVSYTELPGVLLSGKTYTFVFIPLFDSAAAVAPAQHINPKTYQPISDAGHQGFIANIFNSIYNTMRSAVLAAIGVTQQSTSQVQTQTVTIPPSWDWSQNAPIPLPPSGVILLVAPAQSLTKVDLSWSVPDEFIPVNKYKVERMAPGSSVWITLATFDSYTDEYSDTTGLKAGVFQYRIEGDTGTKISYSNVIKITLSDIMPADLSCVGVSSSEIDVSWINKSTNAQYFELYRDIADISQPTKIMGLFDITKTNYIDKDSVLTPDASYEYSLATFKGTPPNVVSAISKCIAGTLDDPALDLVISDKTPKYDSTGGNILINISPVFAPEFLTLYEGLKIVPVVPVQATIDSSGTHVTGSRQYSYSIHGLVPGSVHSYIAKTTTPGGGSREVSNTITVTASIIQPDVTVNLSASPDNVAYNGSGVLTWSAIAKTAGGTMSCTSKDFNTNPNNNNPITTYKGSVNVGPLTSSKNYSVTCTDSSGHSGSASTKVTVSNVSSHVPQAFIHVSPSSVLAGQKTTLSWATEYSTICKSNDFDTSSETLSAGGGTVNGSILITPFSLSDTNSTKTYTVTCYNTDSNGKLQTSVPASVTVTKLISASIPTVKLTASPNSVGSGSQTTLTWSSTNTQTCTATNFGSANNQYGPNGSVLSNPITIPVTYSIVCSYTDATGKVISSKPATATVTIKQPISLDCVTPPIMNGEILYFSKGTSIPAGTYSIVYSRGALKFSPTAQWGLQIHNPFNYGYYEIYYGSKHLSSIGSTDSVTNDSGMGGYSTQAALEAGEKGQQQTVILDSPGQIGVRLSDYDSNYSWFEHYSDNIAGNPNPEFCLVKK